MFSVAPWFVNGRSVMRRILVVIVGLLTLTQIGYGQQFTVGRSIP